MPSALKLTIVMHVQVVMIFKSITLPGQENPHLQFFLFVSSLESI
jgi:hypothetical protein